MELKLSHEIVDQIIFGMENQDQFYKFNMTSLEVVGEEEQSQDCEEGTLVDLPEWNSSMGFNLMEKFVANLRNPVYREILRESLAAGKGVFRRFKNALKERKEIEQLWYQFKEKEMRQYVVEWFTNTLEAINLEKVEVEEIDETGELVTSDFTFLYLSEFDEEDLQGITEYQEYDRASFSENYPELPGEVVTAFYESLQRILNGDEFLRVETPNGDLAGYLCFRETETSGDEKLIISRIVTLYILPEFRGLGLAKAALDKYLADSYKRGVEWIFADIGGQALGFADRLVLDGFAQNSSGLILDLHRWGLENLYS